MKIWPCTCWHWNMWLWSSMGESVWNKMPSVEGEGTGNPVLHQWTSPRRVCQAQWQDTQNHQGQLARIPHWGQQSMFQFEVLEPMATQLLLQNQLPGREGFVWKHSCAHQGKGVWILSSEPGPERPTAGGAWTGVWRRGFIEKFHWLSSSYQFWGHLWEGMQLGSGLKRQCGHKLTLVVKRELRDNTPELPNSLVYIRGNLIS